MPRYHFHAEDGVRFTDPDGAELADPRAARAAGLRYLAELVLDKPELVYETGSFNVTVTDGEGLVLWRIDLGVTGSPAVS